MGATLLAALLVAGPAAAEERVENDNDAGPGSLRVAVAAASPGEVVVIDPGVDPLLSEEIGVDNSLTIRGQGTAAAMAARSETPPTISSCDAVLAHRISLRRRLESELGARPGSEPARLRPQ